MASALGHQEVNLQQRDPQTRPVESCFGTPHDLGRPSTRLANGGAQIGDGVPIGAMWTVVCSMDPRGPDYRVLLSHRGALGVGGAVPCRGQEGVTLSL